MARRLRGMVRPSGLLAAGHPRASLRRFVGGRPPRRRGLLLGNVRDRLRAVSRSRARPSARRAGACAAPRGLPVLFRPVVPRAYGQPDLVLCGPGLGTLTCLCATAGAGAARRLRRLPRRGDACAPDLTVASCPRPGRPAEHAPVTPPTGGWSGPASLRCRPSRGAAALLGRPASGGARRRRSIDSVRSRLPDAQPPVEPGRRRGIRCPHAAGRGDSRLVEAGSPESRVDGDACAPRSRRSWASGCRRARRLHELPRPRLSGALSSTAGSSLLSWLLIPLGAATAGLCWPRGSPK